MKHYHVLVGSEGGYLPDSNYYCTTRRQAEAIATSEARFIMDDEGCHKSGSAKSGLIVIDTGLRLDTIIEVTECQEPDCGEED